MFDHWAGTGEGGDDSNGDRSLSPLINSSNESTGEEDNNGEDGESSNGRANEGQSVRVRKRKAKALFLSVLGRDSSRNGATMPGPRVQAEDAGAAPHVASSAL